MRHEHRPRLRSDGPSHGTHLWRESISVEVNWDRDEPVMPDDVDHVRDGYRRNEYFASGGIMQSAQQQIETAAHGQACKSIAGRRPHCFHVFLNGSVVRWKQAPIDPIGHIGQLDIKPLAWPHEATPIGGQDGISIPVEHHAMPTPCQIQRQNASGLFEDTCRVS
jgi:hypothetical protein